jgi:hypothetical protein
MTNAIHSKVFFTSEPESVEKLDEFISILEYLDIIANGYGFWLMLEIRLFRKERLNEQ